MTTRKTTSKPQRKERIPVSGNRDILTYENIPGYVTRWVNDVDNRIPKYLDAGYVFVKPDGKLMSGEESIHNARSTTEGVLTKNVGKGITAYLMAQKEEWYEEDQKAKSDRVNKLEGKLTEKPLGKDEYGEVKTEVSGSNMSAPRTTKL